jgi:hypothetical protein
VDIARKHSPLVHFIKNNNFVGAKISSPFGRKAPMLGTGIEKWKNFIWSLHLYGWQG